MQDGAKLFSRVKGKKLHEEKIILYTVWTKIIMSSAFDFKMLIKSIFNVYNQILNVCCQIKR